MPEGYVPLELRGEGSETLKAPANASAREAEGTFSVDAGPEFALDVAPQAPPLRELASTMGAAQRVFEEGDAIIFKSPSGYAFLLVRELVPEWDESERQRFACGTRGAGVGGKPTRADMPWFPRSAVQTMVAACRSLELPKLE